MATIDIEVDGKKYIMEWHKPGEHQDEPTGYIAITEACNAEEPCQIVRENSHFYCTEHDYKFDGYVAEGTAKPEECENAGICDSHETYDFRGIA